MSAPTLDTPLAALVRGCLADLSACGILADWLEERGDPRGVLLRRRWKRWTAFVAAAQRGRSTRRMRFHSRSRLGRLARAEKDFESYICRLLGDAFA